MPSNIEIKARARDFPKQRKLVTGLSVSAPENIRQEDIFFWTPRGRLKLRMVPEQPGELIYYERSDIQGPKPSHYTVARVEQPENLKIALGAALGVRGVVRKQRTVFMVKKTRVHLDEVEGLGAFLELEVALKPGASVNEGKAVARKLMRALEIQETDLVDSSYIDLIEGKPSLGKRRSQILREFT